MPRAIISPSVLASDFGNLTAECKRMIKGGADWLHMAQMSWMAILSLISLWWVDDIADAGGALYCFHIEATSKAAIAEHGYRLTFAPSGNAVSLIDVIHKRGMRAGVAISPDTPSTAITDEIGHAADMLLVMTVYPGIAGRGGQKFIERCVPKVAELRARFPEKDIEVDGGVGPKTIDVCAEAAQSIGSNVIVAGTAIFSATDPEQVIATLKASVDAAQARAVQR
ncbi:hypothetical protein H0H92_003549 [Tricholoma furcatifolium]|nr:hypothetical protein H0H92_003549 [Tricholoma furcatifolium]